MTTNSNSAVSVRPWLSVAVTVTVWDSVGPSVVSYDQSQVPSPFWVIVPSEVDRTTKSSAGSSGSLHVPVLVAVSPSSATAAVSSTTVVRIAKVKPCQASGVGTVHANVSTAPRNLMVP